MWIFGPIVWTVNIPTRRDNTPRAVVFVGVNTFHSHQKWSPESGILSRLSTKPFRHFWVETCPKEEVFKLYLLHPGTFSTQIFLAHLVLPQNVSKCKLPNNQLLTNCCGKPLSPPSAFSWPKMVGTVASCAWRICRTCGWAFGASLPFGGFWCSCFFCFFLGGVGKLAVFASWNGFLFGERGSYGALFIVVW